MFIEAFGTFILIIVIFTLTDSRRKAGAASKALEVLWIRKCLESNGYVGHQTVFDWINGVYAN